MTLHLYNTLTKSKELFKPLVPRQVTMYTCGPTVYSHPHIGNFRSFIAADILHRYLEYYGYEVKQVVNITDVGHMTTDDDLAAADGKDKIQAAAEREKKSPYEIARFYEEEFLRLSRLLNIKEASLYPRATEHIPEMIELIKKLIDKGFAYNVGGNVYFEVGKFPDYGRLSGNSMENLMAGARIEINPEKKSPLDFALWKQDPKHLMQWDSPWRNESGVPTQSGGKGFPGWHIECSAMSMKYLGATFDIHTGGEDNIFPHHESEIAQSEAANEKPFVKYWFHTRHLLVNNQKMSKSAGNFYTVKDIMDKGFAPRVLRYALMSVHYRQPLNFTLEGLDAARKAVQRLLDFKNSLVEIVAHTTINNLGIPAPFHGTPYSSGVPETKLSGAPRPSGGSGIDNPTQNDTNDVKKIVEATRERFNTAMNDDLNISEALGAVFDMVRDTNKLALSSGKAGMALRMLEQFDTVLGVLSEEETNLDDEVKRLIEERQLARKNKDYKKSDEIRDKLTKMGITLEDTPQGIRWKRKV
ncbi:MAG: cysteine--tRNA ligase [Planctomycetes bacterium]|nr:cysteine--tRNA ligase [Planctomycetota bacterium]